MLVLTRKTNEQLQIGNGITITILRVHGQSIRIGIDAPRDVPVRRSELAPRAAAPALAQPSTPRCAVSACRIRVSGRPLSAASRWRPNSKPAVSQTPARQLCGIDPEGAWAGGCPLDESKNGGRPPPNGVS